MTMAMTRKQELEWCLERALAAYKIGGPTAALRSIRSDFAVCDATSHLELFEIDRVLKQAAHESEEAFARAVRSFNV